MEYEEKVQNAHKALEAAKAAAGIVVVADEWAEALSNLGSTDPVKDEFISGLYESAVKSKDSCERSARLAINAAIRCEQQVTYDSNKSALQDAERGLSNAQMYAQQTSIALKMARGVADQKEEAG